MAGLLFLGENVLRLDLESREGFSRRGSGRSFHVEGPKTKKKKKKKKAKKKEKRKRHGNQQWKVWYE